MLPQRIRKEPKRASRWRSTAHRDFVRSFACCNCGSTATREAAHVRLGSGAGVGQKPDDWRVVPLCKGPGANIHGYAGCHDNQHGLGERTFWDRYAKAHGQTVEQLIEEFIKASPKRFEIESIRKERGL
jgi:hypothetical protein